MVFFPHSSKLNWCITMQLQKAMATHSRTLAWKIPWMEEPGWLQSVGLHRVGHDWSDLAAYTYIHVFIHVWIYMSINELGASLVSQMVKNLHANAGDLGSIPGLGRSTGEGNSNPVQYSCLENSKNRGAWLATVHGAKKHWTQLSN